MNIAQSDLAYESAGGNEELSDKLLADLKQKRTDCLNGMAQAFGIALVLGVLAFASLLYPVLTPKSPHPIVDWLALRLNPGAFILGLILFFLYVAGHGLTAIHYDTKIKMLLFLRAQQNRPS